MKWVKALSATITFGLSAYICYNLGKMILEIFGIEFEIIKVNYLAISLVGLGIFIIIATVIALWEKMEERK